MKRVNSLLLGLITSITLFAGFATVEAAKSKESFDVHFSDNTLVVTSAQMEEASLYSLQGKLLQRAEGNFVEFELEKGSYRLFAKINGETVSRRIELR